MCHIAVLAISAASLHRYKKSENGKTIMVISYGIRQILALFISIYTPLQIVHTGTDQIVEHSPEPIVMSVRTIYMYAVLCAKTQKQGLRVCIFYNTIKYNIRILSISNSDNFKTHHRSTCVRKLTRSHFAS